MPDLAYTLITSIFALGAGILIGRILLRKVFRKKEEEAREKAKSMAAGA